MTSGSATTEESCPPLARIHSTLRDADLSACPTLDVAILRNVVIDPIEPYLRYLGWRVGRHVRVQFGEYDQVVQEAIGGRAALFASAGCVCVFLSLDVLAPNLTRTFAALDPDAVTAEVERVATLVDQIVAGIRKQTVATILWHGFETPLFPALGIADAQSSLSQADVVVDLNRRVRATLQRTKSAYFVDMNVCRGRLGAAAFYDPRYWHIARAPYSREALRAIAEEDFKYLRALTGTQRKCLVLDCDDVLWGGTIGEDGLPGIKLGRTYPGSPYFELQQEILNLYHRGVILALCSKNNDQDVWDVFRRHPDMVLREEHIAVARINWRDKATNLTEIAATLNIGLDSLVFVDDSEAECDLIRQVLPDVQVLHLPRDQAIQHRTTLATVGWFDTLTVSDDDRHRGARYQQEAARAKDRRDSPNLDDYFRSLEMTVRIQPADPVTIPRIAQLTQKTNQFNLTAHRYSDEQIARLATNEHADVLALSLSDRYGDAGLVGVAILRYQRTAAIVDTFLLSCRVLGRGVEDALLATCASRAASRGATTMVGEFVPSSRNGQVRDFYAQRGFRELKSAANQTRHRTRLDDCPVRIPPHFKAVETRFDHPVGEPYS